MSSRQYLLGNPTWQKNLILSKTLVRSSIRPNHGSHHLPFTVNIINHIARVMVSQGHIVCVWQAVL